MPHTIPTFNLYGEQDDLPDVVHCETIESRSMRLDWTVEQHRHARLHQVLVLTQGGGQVLIEGARHDLGPSTLVNLPAGVIHGFEFLPDTRGFVLTLASEFLDQILTPREGLGPVLARPVCLEAPRALSTEMGALDRAYHTAAFARAQILRGLAGALLGQVARIMYEAQGEAEAPMAATQETPLLAQFMDLVEAQFAKGWSVADYAKHLSVSPTHLSRVTRAATGKPASGLIEERLIREARRFLVFTDLPVSVIAYELGFDDPAYFSRVFRRATGDSPRAFRNQLAEAHAQ